MAEAIPIVARFVAERDQFLQALREMSTQAKAGTQSNTRRDVSMSGIVNLAFLSSDDFDWIVIGCVIVHLLIMLSRANLRRKRRI